MRQVRARKSAREELASTKLLLKPKACFASRGGTVLCWQRAQPSARQENALAGVVGLGTVRQTTMRPLVLHGPILVEKTGKKLASTLRFWH